MASIKDKKVRFDSTTALAQALTATGDNLAKIYFTPEGKIIVNQKDYTGVKSVVAGTAKGSVKVDGTDIDIPGIPLLGNDNKIDPSYLPEGLDDIIDMSASCFEVDAQDNVTRFRQRLEVEPGVYVNWYDYTPEQKAQAIALAAEDDTDPVPEDAHCMVNLIPWQENSRRHEIFAFDRVNLKWVFGSDPYPRNPPYSYLGQYLLEHGVDVDGNVLVITKGTILGSIYRLTNGHLIELSLMPGTADDVPEKAVNPTNRYFTELRAQQAIVGSNNTAARIAALNAIITSGGSGGVDVIAELPITVINGVQVAFKSGTPPEIYNATYATLDDLVEVSQYLQLPVFTAIAKAKSVHSGAYENVLIRYNGYEPGHGPDDAGITLGHLELATPNDEGKPQAADDMLYILTSTGKLYYCDNTSTAHLTNCGYKDADAQKAVVGSTDTSARVTALQQILTFDSNKVSTIRGGGWTKDTTDPEHPVDDPKDDKFISEKLAYESINAVAVQLLWE